VARDYIVTSEIKAKAVKPIVEKLVTIAKDDSLNTFRRLIARTGNVAAARQFIEMGKLFAKRPGGYLRIVKLTDQSGDNTTQVRLEWVERLIKPEIVQKPKAKEQPTVKNEAKAEVKKESVPSKKTVAEKLPVAAQSKTVKKIRKTTRSK